MIEVKICGMEEEEDQAVEDKEDKAEVVGEVEDEIEETRRI
jgi:hypothetical protein